MSRRASGPSTPNNGNRFCNQNYNNANNYYANSNNYRNTNYSQKSVPKPTNSWYNMSFAQRVLNYLPVFKKGGVVEAYLKFLGFPVTSAREDVSESPNHPKSAAVRAILTAYAIGALVKAKRNKMISVYGSMRDINIFNCLVNKSNPEAKLLVHLDVLTPKDTTRINPANANLIIDTQQLINAQLHPNGFLMVDVYKLGNADFSPKSVFNFLVAQQMTGINCLIWVGHVFKGDANTVQMEGGWYRNPDTGLIHFRSDFHSNIYAPHDSCDWLWKESVYHVAPDAHDRALLPPGLHYSLTWTLAHTLGDMVVYTFSLIDGKVFPDVVADPINEYEWMELKIFPTRELDMSWTDTFRVIYNDFVLWSMNFFNLNSSLSNFLLDYCWLVPKRFLVNMPILSAVQTSLHTKTYNRLNFQILVNDIIQQYQNNEKHRLLMQLFPKTFQPPVTELALYVLSNNLKNAENLMSFNFLFGSKVQTYNQILTDIFVPVAPPISSVSWEKVFLIGALALNVGFLLRKFIFAPASFTPQLEDLFFEVSQTTAKNVIYTCLVGPILEEIIKRVSLKGWRVGRLLSFLELFLRIRNLGFDTLEKVIYSLVPFLMHYICDQMSLSNAIIIHCLYNATAILHSQEFSIFYSHLSFVQIGTGSIFKFFPLVFLLCILLYYKTTPSERFKNFRQRFYFDRWENRILYPQDTVLVSSFDQNLSACPRQEFHAPLKESCKILKFSRKVVPFHNKDTILTNPVFWFLPTNVPQYAPGRTDWNLYQTVQSRILTKPPCDPYVQYCGWEELLNQCPEMLLQIRSKNFSAIIWEEAVPQWLDHFEEAVTRRKYKKELFQIEDSRILPRAEFLKTELFVKSDELLLKIDPSTHRIYMRNRAIANVAPAVQVLVGPPLYEVQQRMKSLYSGTPVPFKCKEIYFYLTYAGSFTDHDLSLWFLFVLEQLNSHLSKCFIIVSGDDSVVVYLRNGVVTFFEGDASMFDQSQSFGPLEHEYILLEAFGIDVSVVDLLRTVASNDYVLKTKDSSFRNKIRKEYRPMRDSGGSDTSIGNSLIMMQAWVQAIGNFYKLDLNQSFMSLGFEMKIKTFDSISQVTFLKGLWYRVVDPVFSYYWGPLPSRILKIGKSLRDPRQLYKESKKDFRRSCERFVNDLACSYSYYLPVPLIKMFVQNFNRRPAEKELIEKYKIQAAKFQKPTLHEDAYLQCALRYECPVEWFLEVESLYPKEVFYFIEHPLFFKLAKVDYS